MRKPKEEEKALTLVNENKISESRQREDFEVISKRKEKKVQHEKIIVNIAITFIVELYLSTHLSIYLFIHSGFAG